MNPKIEALLKVLDMNEDEQERWCCINTDRKSYEHLADLAFRLRDSCHDPFGWCAWDRACWEVWNRFHVRSGNDIAKRAHLSQDTKERYCLSWISFWAKPIYWILASLITKEIVADTEEKFDAHLTSERSEIRYGIAQEYLGPKDDGDGYGFWAGPNPSLEEILNVAGRDGSSVIIRFNKDGTDEIIYRWISVEWIPMLEISGE